MPLLDSQATSSTATEPPSGVEARQSETTLEVRAVEVRTSGGPDAGDRALNQQGEQRMRWSNPIEFTITCIGYAVGLGNFWRFPYLCYTHGGGAFLVPYTLVLMIIGIPLFLLELGIGQKFQKGMTQLWMGIHPALGGLGLAGVGATFLVALYYNVIVAWALWYLFHSWTDPLPWADERGGALEFWEVDTLQCRPHVEVSGAPPLPSCGAACGSLGSTCGTFWNSLSCADLVGLGCGCSGCCVAQPSPPPPLATNGTAGSVTPLPTSLCRWDNATDWPQHPGLVHTGGLVPSLAWCLILGWFLIWLCVYKGIASVGKVAWVTALFPYVGELHAQRACSGRAPHSRAAARRSPPRPAPLAAPPPFIPASPLPHAAPTFARHRLVLTQSCLCSSCAGSRCPARPSGSSTIFSAKTRTPYPSCLTARCGSPRPPRSSTRPASAGERSLPSLRTMTRSTTSCATRGSYR